MEARQGQGNGKGSSLRKRFVSGNRLHSLLKNSASNRFWEGHDFSRAAKSSIIGRALAPEVGFLLRKQVFPQPVKAMR